MASDRLISVTGMVIKHVPVGDYDYSVTIFTREWGKLSAFARGARRVGTKLSGLTEPFSFGEFMLYEGRDSYNISDAKISNFFGEFRTDLEASLYGSFFLEICDYYGRENNEDPELLKLLYQSLRALFVPSLDRRLVRAVFEIRSLYIEGEFPGIPDDGSCSEACAYAVDYAVSTPIERLYTFTVSDTVLEELEQICRDNRRRFIDRPLKSLDILGL